MYVRENWTYWTSPYDFSYDVQVVNKWNLLTNSIWMTARALYFRRWTYFTWKYSDYLWWVAPFLSYTSSWSTVYDNVVHQWFPIYYALCDYFWTWLDITINMSWCVVSPLNSWSLITVANFMSWVSLNDVFSFKYDWKDFDYNPDRNNGALLVCFSSQFYNKSMCFWITRYTYWSDCVYPWLCVTSSNQRLFSWYWVALPWGFENLYRQVLNDSPWSNNNFDPWTSDSFSTWNTVLLPDTLDWDISFYENNFWFNENMCYVWTDDLTSVYWTNWIEFQEWTWSTIYALYYSLYNSFWSNKIHNVWSFINVRLMNYATWFKTIAEERWYMAKYNGPDQNVTYTYTWFTFPFANQPVAIYFMSDLLSEVYISEESMWEHIVYYCDLKLNYENYKNWSLDFEDVSDLVDPRIKDRIREYNNRNIPWKDWYSYPWTWSIWDWLMQSWYNIPKDLNPSDLFSDYYEKINWLFKNFNAVNSVWIIPRWIIYPMLFLILFRIIRH